MSLSKRKLRANRANAQKSTGAVSSQGKAVVAQNATKHGLTGCFHVLAPERQEDFDRLLDQFVEAEQPVGGVETQLVRKMAEHTWLAARAVRMQEGCVSNTQSPEQKGNGMCVTIVSHEMDRFLRYQAAHDRAYQRASKELRERRKERQTAEHGFVSQKRVDSDDARKAELHAYKVAVAKARSEAEQARATVASIKAAEKITSVLPPDAAAAIANAGFGSPYDNLGASLNTGSRSKSSANCR